MSWIVGLLALAIGTALGALITKANQKDTETGSGKIKELEEQLAQAQQASNEYQDKVSEHFVKTSELFGEMTENYRTAYQHLATGAQSLCKSGTGAALLKTSLIEQLSANESTQQSDEQIIDASTINTDTQTDVSATAEFVADTSVTKQETPEEPMLAATQEDQAIEAEDTQDKTAETLATSQVESENVVAANSVSLSEQAADSASVELKSTEDFSEAEVSATLDKAVNEVAEPVQVQAADEKAEEAASETINEQPLPDAIHVKDDSSRPSIIH